MRNERTNKLYYTEQFVLSTRHMLSRFMPYFANCSLMVDKMVHKSCFNFSKYIHLPNDGLQLRGEGAIAPLPVQDEGPVVLEHWVGAAPDDNSPQVVLTDPHPLPVLYLRHNWRLRLGIVMSQHPGAAPVHIRRRDQHLPALTVLCQGTIGRVVDPAVVLELQKPGENNLGVKIFFKHVNKLFEKIFQ